MTARRPTTHLCAPRRCDELALFDSRSRLPLNSTPLRSTPRASRAAKLAKPRSKHNTRHVEHPPSNCMTSRPSSLCMRGRLPFPQLIATVGSLHQFACWFLYSNDPRTFSILALAFMLHRSRPTLHFGHSQSTILFLPTYSSHA